jgi:SAM-dependent methyltransferase
MLHLSGFDAAGLELSPSIARWASSTFDVPVLVGPIEDHGELERRSYDVIVLMDVLEHLPDPVRTLERCAELLKSDGIFFLQTPQYRGEAYQNLVDRQDEFLSQLKEAEHLYLFTDESIRMLFAKLGFLEVRLEEAVFPYDMCVVAGRVPLSRVDEEKQDEVLGLSATGRWIRAICDLSDRAKLYEHTSHERLGVIQGLDEHVRAGHQRPSSLTLRALRKAGRFWKGLQ